ncbi:hypothetical protein BST61_g6985 [Cercospora zeina]
MFNFVVCSSGVSDISLATDNFGSSSPGVTAYRHQLSVKLKDHMLAPSSSEMEPTMARQNTHTNPPFCFIPRKPWKDTNIHFPSLTLLWHDSTKAPSSTPLSPLTLISAYNFATPRPTSTSQEQ